MGFSQRSQPIHQIVCWLVGNIRVFLQHERVIFDGVLNWNKSKEKYNEIKLGIRMKNWLIVIRYLYFFHRVLGVFNAKGFVASFCTFWSLSWFTIVAVLLTISRWIRWFRIVLRLSKNSRKKDGTQA
jgi:hypothetical protein